LLSPCWDLELTVGGTRKSGRTVVFFEKENHRHTYVLGRRRKTVDINKIIKIRFEQKKPLDEEK
ncbi:hypothetical protein STEG23_022034, partial [Scotinomys teguina]